MMDQSIRFDLDIINRYDKAGPRYTSYPTALEMHEDFGDKEYREHIAESNAAGGLLSLYFHILFCDTVCFYCACNKIITKNRKHAEPYLVNLYVETFSNTLGKILAAAPDRLSIFNYAHMPARFKTQRQINDADRPSADIKLDILQMVGHKLTAAG